jgi:hypothetical protein
MKIVSPFLIAAGVLACAPMALAVNPNLAPGGLPSAAQYSAQVMPELQGVVPWKTLAEVQPLQRDGKTTPQFGKSVLALDNKVIQVQGFMMPLDTGNQQRHFLVSAVPPSCPFCMPAGPDAVVEVHAKKAVAFSFRPVVVSGRFGLVKDDSAGMLYRMTEAELVETQFK